MFVTTSAPLLLSTKRYLSNHYTPTFRGFDQYLGYYSGAEEHFTHEKQGSGGYTAFDLSNNTGSNVAPLRSAVGPNGTYSVFLYGNETIRHLRAQKDSDRPFYMYLAWNVAHDPNEAPDYYIQKNSDISDKGRRLFAAMMSALDDALRAIVAELKSTGVYDNTVIFVTTDNGGNLGGSGNNYPLRGGKYTFWEGGVRGIGFVHSALLPQDRRGTHWNGLMHAADLYPTIAGLAGASTKDSGPIAIDGFDMWDAIVNNKSSPRESIVININTYTPEGQRLNSTLGIVRQGRYKLIQGYPGWGNPNWDGWVKPPTVQISDAEQDRYSAKIAQYAGQHVPYFSDPYPGVKPCDAKPCLFDVEADPTEHHDISDQYPDVVKQMTQLIVDAARSEQSVQQAGLCPTQYGTNPDPRCTEEAKKSGFWEPWLQSP